jgi:hypothetical protein
MDALVIVIAALDVRKMPEKRERSVTMKMVLKN